MAALNPEDNCFLKSITGKRGDRSYYDSAGFKKIETRKDMSGNDRMIKGEK